MSQVCPFTLSTRIVGETSDYVAPETAGLLGPNCEVTVKADIFSLGITIFVAVSDRVEEVKTLVGAYRLGHGALDTEAVENLIPVEGLGAQVRGLLAALIVGCLQMDPELRPSTAEIKAKLLEMILVVGWICMCCSV
jgi:serine/threonine protein kinase